MDWLPWSIKWRWHVLSPAAGSRQSIEMLSTLCHGLLHRTSQTCGPPWKDLHMGCMRGDLCLSHRMKTWAHLSSAASLLVWAMPCGTTRAMQRLSIARQGDGRKSTRRKGTNMPGWLKKSPRLPKLSSINQLYAGIAQILLKGSAETQHDNLQLLHPVKVISKMAHERSFHGAVKYLHHAIGVKMIGYIVVGHRA